MKIGIFGRGQLKNKKIIPELENIGRMIAAKNYTVVTGGTNGYPHVVALAAIKAGGKAISYATGLKISDHLKYHDVDLSSYSKIIFQKKYFNKKLSGVDNYFRSLVMCLDIDAAIIIGGRVGTMYEATILSGLGKDIFVLSESGGIAGETIKNFKKEGHKEKSRITFFKNSKSLKKFL